MDALHIAFAVAGLATHAAVAQIAQSNFDLDGEGWAVQTRTQDGATVNGAYTPTWVSSGGVDGAYLSITDPNNQYSFFEAPEAYLGDQAAAYGETFRFSLRTNLFDHEPGRWVILESGTTRLTALAADPVVGAWTLSEIVLGEGFWYSGVGTGGPLASESEIRAVLGNLTSLLVGAEYGSTLGAEVVSLDAVGMIPAPGTAALVAGSLAFAARRRR